MARRIKIQYARLFRKKPTKSERILWEELRNKQFLNLKFKRQYIILGYILDFYCPQCKLAIEIDGGIHNKQKEGDKKRQKIIEEKGIFFLRFKSEDVEKNTYQVIKKITTSPSLFRAKRGMERGSSPPASLCEAMRAGGGEDGLS